MKYASIDIGTNTVLLTVVDYRDGRLEDAWDQSIIARLGEGLKETGVLSRAAMDRAFGALTRYRKTAEDFEVKDVYCVGTAALREARNSRVFIERVRDELGITVRVITGKEEAYYTYLSVKHDRFPGLERFVVVDIGGGSTELILGDLMRFVDFVSLPMGSVKLTEMFVKHDPPTEDEIARLNRFLRETISTPFDGRGLGLVGTAGTVTNLAGLVLGLSSYDKAKIHGLRVSAAEIDRVIAQMAAMPVSERRKMKGMEAGREDILLQGVILMRQIMTYFDAPEVTVSAHGVRYGVLYEKLGGGGEGT